MRPETPEIQRPLRYGYTTGACAAAASLAAACRMLTQIELKQVEITLPRGQRPVFRLEYCRLTATGAEAATIKDAGDDPDVTHGALIFAQVILNAAPGVRFQAGPGVGTVTRPGLPIPPGEPAINPVPRRMMRDAVAGVAAGAGRPGDVELTVSIPGGEALAARTLNPRLGIVRARQELGTTGVVVTHDMRSAYTVGDRIAMLYKGRIRQVGTIAEIQATDDPVVRNFIEGRPFDPEAIPAEVTA